ncbi:DUF397 domain-containing protein [Streptomyces sp. CA-181903]|uniref:DUF397 domain-containing protein n=1 Tax=Streptomyces sp. CA-181903 TaxID=3240055 RepID=UPI003D8FCC25
MIFSNGTPASAFADAQWVKSSDSIGEGNCVELAQLPGGEVAVRNSRFPDGAALVYTREEMVAFLRGAKRCEFDGLVD